MATEQVSMWSIRQLNFVTEATPHPAEMVSVLHQLLNICCGILRF